MSDIRPFLSQLSFTDTNQEHLIAGKIVQEWISSGASSIIHYMYYASYVLMNKDKNILNDYLLADHLMLDGIGMQICMQIITGRKIANLNGTDLSPLFIEEFVKNKIPIVFYGTTEKNIQSCNEQLQQQYGKPVLSYYQNGYSELNLDKVPDCSALFIGMGTPRQERWVTNHIDWIRSKKLIVFTVGGYFDFLSGFYIRAPKWVRAIKMEWAWRTLLHPTRHYQKRLRDTTILFLPWMHKWKGYSKSIHFRNL